MSPPNNKEEIKRYIRKHVQRSSDNLLMHLKRLMDQERIILRRALMEEINHQISQTLAKETLSQFVSLLVGNKEINQVLENHKKEMKQEIEQTARKELDRIVGDRKYHTINKAYFDAFRQEGQLAIVHMKTETNQALKKFNHELSEIDKLKAEVSTYKRISILNTFLLGVGSIGFGYWIYKNRDE